MTTSSLTSYVSTVGVGQRQGFFDVRASTPTTGAIHEGVGEWHVYRGGLRIPEASAYGILDFGWIGLPGDRVVGRFVDRAGNAGARVEYSFAWTASFTRVQYVDNFGNDALDGLTPATAVATRAQARANIVAAGLTANQSAAIYFKRDQVHTFAAGGPVWDGNALAVAHHILVGAYGSGARPILRATGGPATAFFTGPLCALHLKDLDIDGVTNTIFTGSLAVNAARNGAVSKAPLNLMLDNVLIRNCETGVFIQDNTVTSDADLNGGRNDFVSMRDVEIRDTGNFHCSWFVGCRYVHRERCLFLRQQPILVSDRNNDRVSNWRHSYCRDMVWDTRGGVGVNGGVRWQWGGDGETTWQYGSYLDCTYYGTDPSIAAVRHGRKAPAGTAEAGGLFDVRWVNLRTNECRVTVGSASNGGGTVARVQFWDCTIGGSAQLEASTLGTLQSVEFRNCSTSLYGTSPVGAHFQILGATAARFADGFLTIRGHQAVHPAGLSAVFLVASNLTQAEVLPKLSSACEKNHMATGATSGAAPSWAYGGFLIAPFNSQTWELSLAAWQSAKGNEAGSSIRINSTLGIVWPGTAAANMVDYDPRYAALGGVMDGQGLSLAYATDGGGLLRASPSDPGPFEFGASAFPALPELVDTDHPVRIKNLSGARFKGWQRIVYDGVIPDAYGLTAGTQWVRGVQTGLDTRSVDVLVDLAAGATLTLPNLVASPATAPAPVAPTVNFTGGNPTLAGNAMTLVSETTDGQAIVYHHRRRQGVWVVDMWSRWYPNEPWIRSEVMVTHSDTTSTALQATWPDHLLTWGTGQLTILGRTAAAGSIVQNGTVFGDEQARAFPVVWVFPSRIRNSDDDASILAMQAFGLTGHGIKVVHPDGPPYEMPWSATWGSDAFPSARDRLHNWDASPFGIRRRGPDSGPQADQAFVRYEPMFEIGATRTTYLEGFRWAARPCHALEPDGSQVSPTSRPTLRIWDGRPHFNDANPDKLGKLESLPPGSEAVPAPLSNGWYGPNVEHWLLNGLAAAVRYTASPCLQHLLRNQALLYLMAKYPDVATYYAYSSLFSTRDIIWEPLLAVHCWRELADRTLAGQVRQRFIDRCKPSGPTGAIYQWVAQAPYGDIWDVRFDAGASVPIVPGWIPWQQGPACWTMDYAIRQFAPAIDHMAPFIAAGANRVLADCWVFDKVRWIFFERRALSGEMSRAGGFETEWCPPLLPYILRYDPENTNAAEIWQQILNEQAAVPGGTALRWFPPNQLGYEIGGGDPPGGPGGGPSSPLRPGRSGWGMGMAVGL